MRKVTLAIALAALVLFAGCNKDKETQGTILKASIEQHKSDSKTSLNPTNGAINWTAGDKIIVYNGTSSATFTLSAGAGSTNGTFNYAGEFEITDDTKAVYPETCVITDNGMTFTLPEEQNLASPGSFANGANPMLGIKAGDGFTFVSVCGGLGLSMTGDNVDITAIEIVSENEMLTGTYTGYFNNDNIDVANGTNNVRLNCTTKLTSEAKEFYIVLPVGVLGNGFTLNIYNGTADPIFTQTTTTDLTVELNKVKKMNTLEVTMTPVSTVPEGAITGLFTINANGDQVYFSKGNLQYTKSTGEWSFMEHQYDMVETDGQDVGENYANQDVVSLFGWATSGYNHGAVAYQPWSTSSSYLDYYAYGMITNRLYSQTPMTADWGYNAIVNGGNEENSGWRTLTGKDDNDGDGEWDYLFNTRNTASGIRFAMGIVNNVHGAILLPDNWNESNYELIIRDEYNSFFYNNITIEDWTNIFEANGAVFLPEAGTRYGTSISGGNDYWSSSMYYYYCASYISTSGWSGCHINRNVGHPVRLVRNAE